MPYINRRTNRNEIETIDEFFTHKEAIKTLKEYQMADHSAHYYISRRCTKAYAESWTQKNWSASLSQNQSSTRLQIHFQNQQPAGRLTHQNSLKEFKDGERNRSTKVDQTYTTNSENITTKSSAKEKNNERSQHPRFSFCHWVHTKRHEHRSNHTTSRRHLKYSKAHRAKQRSTLRRSTSPTRFEFPFVDLFSYGRKQNPLLDSPFYVALGLLHTAYEFFSRA